jgi:hypothetical protein
MESLCGISRLGTVVVVGAVLLRAFWIISMVQTVCSWWWERDVEPLTARLRSSSKLESSSSSSHLSAKETCRSFNCKFHCYFLVENDKTCDELDCFGRTPRGGR